MDHRSIIFVIAGLSIGGAERQLLYLVRKLDRNRFVPIVATLQQNGMLEAEFAKEGIEIIHVRRRGRWDLLPVCQLVALMRKRAVAVVVTLLAPATLYGLLAARLARVPVRIATERGTKYTVLRRSHQIYLAFESLILRDASRVVANSEAGRSFVLSRGVDSEKTCVVYNGLEPLAHPTLTVAQLRQRLNIPIEAPIIGTVASLTPKKDHITLLHAAALVLKRRSNVCFILVGDGPLRPQIEHLAKELAIMNQLRLVGVKEDIANWLTAFDIVVLASAEREGCSNVLVEAQSLGKPVVATDVGGNSEVLENGETGLLVEARSPEKLAEAILKLLNDSFVAKRMGENGRQFVASKFSLETYVHAWEALFDVKTKYGTS